MVVRVKPAMVTQHFNSMSCLVFNIGTHTKHTNFGLNAGEIASLRCNNYKISFVYNGMQLLDRIFYSRQDYSRNDASVTRLNAFFHSTDPAKISILLDLIWTRRRTKVIFPGCIECPDLAKQLQPVQPRSFKIPV